MIQGAMRITCEQRRYLECLSKGMPLKQMAPELGWTYRQFLDFGEFFFGRDFEERSKRDPALREWSSNAGAIGL